MKSVVSQRKSVNISEGSQARALRQVNQARTFRLGNQGSQMSVDFRRQRKIPIGNNPSQF